MCRRIVIFVLGLLLSSAPTLSQGADLVWVVQGGLRLQQHTNPLLIEEGFPKAGQSLTGVGLSLAALAGLQLSDRVSLAAQIDIGEVLLANIRRNASEQFALFANDFMLNRPGTQGSADWLLAESLFLREMYATFWLHERGWHRLYVGQRHISLASSALFDGYALGAFIEVDLRKRRWRKRKPLLLKFSVFLPDSSWTIQGKRSPTAYFSLLYDKRWLQVEAHVAYMFDGEGMTARMLWPALQQNVPSFQNANIPASCQLRSLGCEMPGSSGHHFWAGATIRAGARPNHRGLRLFATAIAYGGAFQVKLPELPDQLAGFGVYLNAGVSIENSGVTGTLRMMYSMGAEKGTGTNGYLHGFRSIAPQLRHQDVMFPGGLASSGAKRTLGLSQLSNGYWGIQLALGYARRSADFKLLLGAYGSDFNTPVPSLDRAATSETALDIELNARASVDLGPWMKLVGQFDVFLPGGFLIDRSRPAGVRLWMGLDFSFRSWD